MPIAQHNLVVFIKQQIERQLPGHKAHKMMSPGGRILVPDQNSNPQPSAVLIMLYYTAGKLNVVMIKRAEYDGVHSGQIAFPGGKKEAGDDNLLTTALRETYEEIGVNPDDVEIIGKLSPLFIPVSNMCVHPWVGFYNERPLFVKQDQEVQQVLSIPLAQLLQKETVSKAIFEGEKYQVEAPCYHLNGLKIWGASAMILSEFLTVIEAIPSQYLYNPNSTKNAEKFK